MTGRVPTRSLLRSWLSGPAAVAFSADDSLYATVSPPGITKGFGALSRPERLSHWVP